MPQIEAGINTPCAGGKFYQDRLISSLFGIEGRTITAELGCNIPPLLKDAEDLASIQKDLWFAFPAPREIGLCNRFYHDSDEAIYALYSVYREMMRSMRDKGISGHILHCDNPVSEELEALAGRRVFFFSHIETKKTLEILLEYQATVAVRSSALGLIEDLMDEYDVQKIILIDSREDDLHRALEIKDAEHLICGGYCQDSCDFYWKSMVENASVIR